MTDIRQKFVNRLDWTTIVLYLILVIWGLVSIYSADFNPEYRYIYDMHQTYGKQLIWIGFAFLIGILILLIDSKFYSAFAYYIYGAVVILLILVLIFGKEVNNSRSWFEIGQFRLQPAEFGKFATCLAIAKYMSGFNMKITLASKDLYIILFLLLAPALLILGQKDTGSALVYITFIFVMYREGLSGGFLFMFLMACMLFIMTLKVEMWIVVILTFAICFGFYWRERKLLFRRKIKEAAIVLGVFIGIFIFFFIIFEASGLFFHANIKEYKSDFLLTASMPIEDLAKLSNRDAYSIYLFNYTALIAIIVFSIAAYLVSIRYKIKHIGLIVLMLIGCISYSVSVNFIFQNILKKHQRVRINVILGKEKDPKGVGYNLNQSLIAIGSGGLTGKGFLQGTQTKYKFVPEQSTDFIFCTVGEEFGLLGTTGLIILFFALLVRVLKLAERQKSSFSRIFGWGVASILFFHIAINIGMTIGIVPVIGIPLPYFSYGGSSLWSFTILLFIFLRLDVSRTESL